MPLRVMMAVPGSWRGLCSPWRRDPKPGLAVRAIFSRAECHTGLPPLIANKAGGSSGTGCGPGDDVSEVR